MNSLFATLLSVHIFSGLIGTIALYATLLSLLRKEVIKKSFFCRALLAWISFVISWITGGYYYWFYYGNAVKPIIKAGKYAWGHTIVMEAKEHVFLLLPVISLIVALIAWTSTECINTNAKLKSSVVYLTSVACAIAVIIALSGILISGSAR